MRRKTSIQYIKILNLTFIQVSAVNTYFAFEFANCHPNIRSPAKLTVTYLIIVQTQKLKKWKWERIEKESQRE